MGRVVWERKTGNNIILGMDQGSVKDSISENRHGDRREINEQINQEGEDSGKKKHVLRILEASSSINMTSSWRNVVLSAWRCTASLREAEREEVKLCSALREFLYALPFSASITQRRKRKQQTQGHFKCNSVQPKI